MRLWQATGNVGQIPFNPSESANFLESNRLSIGLQLRTLGGYPTNPSPFIWPQKKEPRSWAQ